MRRGILSRVPVFHWDLGRNAIWENGRSCFTARTSCVDQHMLQTRYLDREIRAESRAHGSEMWVSSHSLPCHGWSNQEKTSRFKLIQPLVKPTNRCQFHHIAEIPSYLARSSQDVNPRIPGTVAYAMSRLASKLPGLYRIVASVFSHMVPVRLDTRVRHGR